MYLAATHQGAKSRPSSLPALTTWSFAHSKCSPVATCSSDITRDLRHPAPQRCATGAGGQIVGRAAENSGPRKACGSNGRVLRLEAPAFADVLQRPVDRLPCRRSRSRWSPIRCFGSMISRGVRSSVGASQPSPTMHVTVDAAAQDRGVRCRHIQRIGAQVGRTAVAGFDNCYAWWVAPRKQIANASGDLETKAHLLGRPIARPGRSVARHGIAGVSSRRRLTARPAGEVSNTRGAPAAVREQCGSSRPDPISALRHEWGRRVGNLGRSGQVRGWRLLWW